MAERKPLDTTKMIERVANYKANTAFTECYCKSSNLQERKIKGLGIAIASWADWSGNIIMEIFKSALEDANFHNEASKVQEMIDKLMGGK